MAIYLNSRRSFLQSLLLESTAVASGVIFGGIRRARAIDLLAWPAKPFSEHKLAAAMTDCIGTTEVPVTSKITLRAPTIAQNGASVPITISIDHAMTPENYIQTVYVFVDHNPDPLAAELQFTPENGQAYFQGRIKMRKTDQVRIIAKTNTGTLMAAKPKVVKVTIGGCGG